MAIFIQTNVLRHSLYLPKVSQPCCQNSAPLHVLPLPCVNGSSMKYLKYPPNCLIHQQFAPILKHRRSEPVVNYWNGSAVFLLDGKDKSEKDNQYVYIISGEELARLGKDYIKFLFGKGKSVRLKRTMNKWKLFFQSWNEKEEDPFWFDSPEKCKEIFRSWEFVCAFISSMSKKQKMEVGVNLPVTVRVVVGEASANE